MATGTFGRGQLVYFKNPDNSRWGQLVNTQNILLLRIPIIPKYVPIQFKRLQFPIRLVFEMTINKSQGQTMSVCGLDLSTSYFLHG
jgi:ATP-dependent exoDNAse (exonuclease V) alpha subunit